MSMKPGAMYSPVRSTTRLAGDCSNRPIATTLPLRTAMSPTYHGAPVPSTIRPPLRIRSAVSPSRAKAVPAARMPIKSKLAAVTRFIGISLIAFRAYTASPFTPPVNRARSRSYSKPVEITRATSLTAVRRKSIESPLALRAQSYYGQAFWRFLNILGNGRSPACEPS